MKVFHGLSELKLDRKHSVLTIGNFDGVHLGHQELLSETLRLSKESGAQSCVCTFRPHPQEVLRPGVKVELLTTYAEKLQILEEKGIDITVEELFSQSFFNQSPKDFFNKVIIEGFKASHLVVGYDFKFGKDRSGNSETLKAFCQEAGVTLSWLHPKTVDNEICSSSFIRGLLRNKKVSQAEKYLGRYFFYRDVIRKGDQRGRLLGFPTANMRIENKCELPNGVYATQSIIKKGNFKGKYPSVTNIGTRPTFKNEGEKIIETHFLSPGLQNFDIYGEEVEVQFIEFFRDERKFQSFEELKNQITSDKNQALQFFNLTL